MSLLFRTEARANKHPRVLKALKKLSRDDWRVVVTESAQRLNGITTTLLPKRLDRIVAALVKLDQKTWRDVVAVSVWPAGYAESWEEDAIERQRQEQRAKGKGKGNRGRKNDRGRGARPPGGWRVEEQPHRIQVRVDDLDMDAFDGITLTDHDDTDTKNQEVDLAYMLSVSHRVGPFAYLSSQNLREIRESFRIYGETKNPEGLKLLKRARGRGSRGRGVFNHPSDVPVRKAKDIAEITNTNGSGTHEVWERMDAWVAAQGAPAVIETVKRVYAANGSPWSVGEENWWLSQLMPVAKISKGRGARDHRIFLSGIERYELCDILTDVELQDAALHAETFDEPAPLPEPKAELPAPTLTRCEEAKHYLFVTGGDKRAAARAMGVARSTYYQILKRCLPAGNRGRAGRLMPSAPRVFFGVGTPVELRFSTHTSGGNIMGDEICPYPVARGEKGVVVGSDDTHVYVRPDFAKEAGKNRSLMDIRVDGDAIRIPWSEAMDTLKPLNIGLPRGRAVQNPEVYFAKLLKAFLDENRELLADNHTGGVTVRKLAEEARWNQESAERFGAPKAASKWKAATARLNALAATMGR